VDRFVYICMEHVSGNEKLDSVEWKLWVAEPLRASAIRQAHDSIVNTHGVWNFYWPWLSKEVRDYIRNCEICKETKAPNMALRSPMGQQNISVRPFQKLYVYILGPYPGQVLFTRNFHLSHFSNNFNKKLAPRFSKCRVKQKWGNAFYLLESPQGKEIGTYAKDIRS